MPLTGGLFVRQRLSSEPDRYRGRRRVPTPPRSRYAAVVTSAFVGAGVVALGAASNLPDAKDVSPEVLQNLKSSQIAADALNSRTDDANRASRSNDRSEGAEEVSADVSAEDIYLLPLDDYQFTSAYGVRFGKLHAGIDLAAADGTPYKAVHAGTVTSAGYKRRLRLLDHRPAEGRHRDHLRALAPPAGEKGRRGESGPGHRRGRQHRVLVRDAPSPRDPREGHPVDPIVFLKERGVDIKLQIESVYAGLAAAEAAS